MRRNFLKALAAAAFAALAGCGPFWVDPYIAVTESPLNWVEIHYYDLKAKPVRRVAVYLSGTGLVEIRKGASQRVSNDFAAETADRAWNDYRTQKLHVDPAHLNDLFQNLVNYGLLDYEKTGRAAKEPSPDRFLAVRANLSNTTYTDQVNILEADPDLAEQLLDVVREFDHPGL